MEEVSIFATLYSKPPFVDRFEQDGRKGVDVVVPLLNTNELWERNLLSIYKEVPVNRLLLGDGGCTDGSVDIARKFPRVVVADQKSFKSLGFSIKDLIGRVETEWFLYLHSDVFLPDQWYDAMIKHQGEAEWFECMRHNAVIFQYPDHAYQAAERAYSGSQMGKSEIVKKAIAALEDDFLYRNEDMIIMEMVRRAGYRYAKVSDARHYHQLMNKRGEKEPRLKAVSVQRESDPNWEIRMWNMQARGIIKYTLPRKYLVMEVNLALFTLDQLGALDWKEFTDWTAKTNPAWSGLINKRGALEQRIRALAKRARKLLKKP